MHGRLGKAVWIFGLVNLCGGSAIALDEKKSGVFLSVCQFLGK